MGMVGDSQPMNGVVGTIVLSATDKIQQWESGCDERPGTAEKVGVSSILSNDIIRLVLTIQAAKIDVQYMGSLWCNHYHDRRMQRPCCLHYVLMWLTQGLATPATINQTLWQWPLPKNLMPTDIVRGHCTPKITIPENGHIVRPHNEITRPYIMI